MEDTEKDAADRLREGYEQLKSEAETLQNQAREKMNQLKGRMDAYRDEASELLDSTNVYIKENPQKSAIIAALSGFTLGMFIGLLVRGGKN